MQWNQKNVGAQTLCAQTSLYKWCENEATCININTKQTTIIKKLKSSKTTFILICHKTNAFVKM